jgi:uncharacterized protein
MANGVGMKFTQLAFIVTDDCNFNCSYCQQIKERKYMKRSTIKKAVTFFYPFLDEEAYIVFYGGEPLLAFDTIKYAVSVLQKKNKEGEKTLKFSLTTNGSLLTDKMLSYFHRHGFTLTLSFDGIAQDISRKSGSLALMREIIQEINKGKYPGIKFSTISVFSPGTVNYLAESMQSIIETGITDMAVILAQNIPWYESALLALEKELISLADFLVMYYKKEGIIPVSNFRGAGPPRMTDEETPCFTCVAGFRRMAVSPEENLWGCYVFHDYLKNQEENQDFHTYRFGMLDDFITNYEMVYPRIIRNYALLKQDSFFTENQYCLFCEEVTKCSVCPVSAAYASSFIGKISPWVCRIHRLQEQVNRKFLEKRDRLKVSS